MMPAALIALVVFVVVALAAFGLGSIVRPAQRAGPTHQRAPGQRAQGSRAGRRGRTRPPARRATQPDSRPGHPAAAIRHASPTSRKCWRRPACQCAPAIFWAISAACRGGATTSWPMRFSRRVEVAWVAMLVGFVLPYSYASYRRNKRFEKFEELFPEAIDTLARAVRAGHAFTTALEMITDEVAEPVAGEFRQLYEEQKFGMPVRDALMNLTERMPLVDVKFFVTAVMLQRETGGNLAEILDNLSYVIRERFKIQRQVRVYTAQGPAHHGLADGDAARSS